MVGSSRQDCYVDYQNTVNPDTLSVSCFTLFQILAKRLRCIWLPFLASDINHSNRGSDLSLVDTRLTQRSAQTLRLFYDDDTIAELIPQYFFDEYKVTLVAAQLDYCRLLFGEDVVEYFFVDDRLDILEHLLQALPCLTQAYALGNPVVSLVRYHYSHSQCGMVWQNQVTLELRASSRVSRPPDVKEALKDLYSKICANQRPNREGQYKVLGYQSLFQRLDSSAVVHTDQSSAAQSNPSGSGCDFFLPLLTSVGFGLCSGSASFLVLLYCRQKQPNFWSWQRVAFWDMAITLGVCAFSLMVMMLDRCVQRSRAGCSGGADLSDAATPLVASAV